MALTSDQIQNTYAVAYATSKAGHAAAHIAGLQAVASRAQADYHRVVHRKTIEALAAEAEAPFPFRHAMTYDEANNQWIGVADWLRAHIGGTEATE